MWRRVRRARDIVGQAAFDVARWRVCAARGRMSGFWHCPGSISCSAWFSASDSALLGWRSDIVFYAAVRLWDRDRGDRDLGESIVSRDADLLCRRRREVDDPGRPYGPRSWIVTTALSPVSTLVTRAVVPSGSVLLAALSPCGSILLPSAISMPVNFFA